MNADIDASTASQGKIKSSGKEMYVPVLLFVACLAAQVFLVFFKSYNWDEFLHYNFVYQIRNGTLNLPFQVIHLRLLIWAPDIAENILDQMHAARIFMWCIHLITLFMIYAISRQFTNSYNSFFASFAYLGAGFVFNQGFSIRVDPVVTTTLMCALFLMVRGELSLLKAIAVGALAGLAGMMTFKAAFYAPCFAGLAWLKFQETRNRTHLVGLLGLMAVTAFLSFGFFYLAHTWNFTEAAETLRRTSSTSFYLRWMNTSFRFADYIRAEIILAPLFFFCILLAPLSWRRAGLKAETRLALAGFIAPLAVLLFYRNTFPYFFVFILAPVAVAIAPALGLLRDRYGNVFLSVLLAATPFTLVILEPRDMIGKQRALIDYVHQEFPEKTGYLDYSGMIADYPRILKFLTTGNGIRFYYEQADPVVGREIDSGRLPFIIANEEVILAALEGRPVRETFLPADLAAMNGNYVRQWGVLWREGKQIPAGRPPFEFRLRRGGEFVLAGAPLTIDGVTVVHGSRITLDQGRHLVSGRRAAPSTLWRGDKLPADPPNIPVDRVFTRF